MHSIIWKYSNSPIQHRSSGPVRFHWKARTFQILHDLFCGIYFFFLRNIFPTLHSVEFSLKNFPWKKLIWRSEGTGLLYFFLENMGTVADVVPDRSSHQNSPLQENGFPCRCRYKCKMFNLYRICLHLINLLIYTTYIFYISYFSKVFSCTFAFAQY